MIFTETEKDALRTMLAYRGIGICPTTLTINKKVLRGLQKQKWNVDNKTVVHINSRREKEKETFWIIVEYNYALCKKCLNPFYMSELYLDQCVYCSNYAPLIIAKEMFDKYRRFKFDHEAYLSLDIRSHGATLLSNVTMLVARQPCGAYCPAGCVNFNNDSIKVQTYKVCFNRLYTTDMDTVNFFYSDPKCFKQFHEYLQKVATNFLKLEHLRNKRSWKRWWRKTLRSRQSPRGNRRQNTSIGGE